MAAYLAGSLTRDHGDNPVPDSNIARWNSKATLVFTLELKEEKSEEKKLDKEKKLTHIS